MKVLTEIEIKQVTDDAIRIDHQRIKDMLTEAWEAGEEMELDDYFAIIDFQGEEE